MWTYVLQHHKDWMAERMRQVETSEELETVKNWIELADGPLSAGSSPLRSDGEDGGAEHALVVSVFESLTETLRDVSFPGNVARQEYWTSDWEQFVMPVVDRFGIALSNWQDLMRYDFSNRLLSRLTAVR